MKEKSRLECRIDPDTHRGLKALAADAGVSLNQLLEGVLGWTVRQAHAGFPERDNNLFVTSVDGEGVWLGETGYDDDGNPSGKPQVFCVLDFSVDRAIRSPREYNW